MRSFHHLIDSLLFGRLPQMRRDWAREKAGRPRQRSTFLASVSHFVLCTLAAVALPATAQYGGTPSSAADFSLKPFSVIVAASATHDSNIFKTRLANADNIGTGSVGLRFDKPYGLQTIQLGYTEKVVRYDRFSYLNFEGRDYFGTWLWYASPRVHGTLTFNHGESLTPFYDTNLSRLRNLRTTEEQAFTLEGWITGNWHVVLGASQNQQKSERSALVAIQPDFQANNIEVGVKYITPPGNSVALVQRSTRGEYDNIFANPGGSSSSDYRETLSDLRISWNVTARSALNGSVGWRNHHTENSIQSDFSGPAVSLGYSWLPTSKLKFNIVASQDNYPLQDPSYSYSQRNAIVLGSTWEITAKTGMRIALDRSVTEYRGIGPIPATGPARKDTLDNAEIGLYWKALRSLALDASIRREQRTSNSILNNFDATVGRINATLSF